jgi:hypothetical protein
MKNQFIENQKLLYLKNIKRGCWDAKKQAVKVGVYEQILLCLSES